MSEEEKQAIETIKLLKIGIEKLNALGKFLNTFVTDDEKVILDKEDIKAIYIVLNLIEKQQKEIEELKKDKKALVNNYNNVLESFISKDKIREKIEFYKRYGKIENSNEYVMSVEIEVLEELLEEGE